MTAAGALLALTLGANASADGATQAQAAVSDLAAMMQGAAPGDTVYIPEGLYRTTGSIELSGLRDVTIAARPGERPVISGSVELKGWRRVSDRRVLRTVGRDAAKRLYVTDLKKAGVEDLGDPCKTGKRPELFCGGEIQTLSRWPDEGFAYGGRALGETVIPPVENGNSGAVEPIFEYLDDRVARWGTEKDPRIFGYFFYDWTHKYMYIDSVDVARHALIVSNHGRNGSRSRYRHGLRYIGLNLLCELDRPGEWYLDRATSLLYWCPPEGVNPVKGAPAVTFTLNQSKFMLVLRDCENVTLEGLTFEQSRGSAIRIEGGSGCTVKDCRILGVACDGIDVQGGRRHRIDGCYIAHIGKQGLRMVGGDRRTLERADFEVSNCYIADFARLERTYNSAVCLEGCGSVMHHNEMCYAPSSAMSLAGNDLIAEFNYIHDVALESDDQGGFDLYLNPSMRGIELRYNRWSNIVGGTRYGVGAIRLDDLISGFRIYGNLFENCGAVEFGAVQIHGGSENLIEDNVFYGCRYAVSFTHYGEQKWKETFERIHESVYGDVDISSPLYLQRYPEIRELGRNIDVNIIRNNLILDCKQDVWYNNDGRQIESGNVLGHIDGHPAEYFCTAEYLHPLGIRRVPVEDMRILTNKWLSNE